MPTEQLDPPSLRAGSRLIDLLSNRRWSYRTEPFPHIYAEEVFIPTVYNQLAASFREILARKPGLEAGGQRFQYHGSDGLLMPFHPSLSGPLSLFVSRPWVDLVAQATGAHVTNDVNGALHYHRGGSKSGFVHQDFSSCWFVDHPRDDGINVTDTDLCCYRTGQTFAGGLVPKERVRAVAVFFYLNNPTWRPGDGGETGLYRSPNDPVDRPAAAIPPINNSMVIFECSPKSLHSFIKNKFNPTSSVVVWLHTTRQDAVAKWGSNPIHYAKE
jgi:hypothetical protein